MPRLLGVVRIAVWTCLVATGFAWTSVALGSAEDGTEDQSSEKAQRVDAHLWHLLRHRWWRELPDPPHRPTVEAVSAKALAVAWEAPDSTTDIAGYDVEFRVHDAVEYSRWEHADTDTATTIHGLMPSTLYHVRVRAVNDAGPGDWSTPGEGMTENAAPVFVEGVAAVRTLPENSPGGLAVGAPLRATDADGDTVTYGLGGMDAEAFSIDVSTGQLRTRSGYAYDYESDDWYEIVVTAGDGRGNESEITVTVRVLDELEPPLKPDPPTVAPTGVDTLTVSWTAPANAGRPNITGYELQYRGSRKPFVLWSETPTGTRTEITGLNGDTYEVQVRAVNDEGKGAWSDSGNGTVRGNRSPTVNQGLLNDVTMSVEETERLVPVRTAFSDPDGDNLTLAASSSKGNVVAASMSGDSVSLRPAATGVVRIDITATDTHGATATGSFDVTVISTPLQPNLQVGRPAVDNASPATGAMITLSVTVSNTGNGNSPATTLRYYRSTDDTISRSDVQVETDAVGVLRPSGTSAESVALTAPTTVGTYHYGACVDAVADESNTTDNCSWSVQVDVKEPAKVPDLEVRTPSVDDDQIDADETFTLSAIVTNAGEGNSPATTLRYYRSTDDTISRTDAEVGTDAVRALPPSTASAESILLTAPLTPGTYYYGACVDAVADETDTTNNCSTSVQVVAKQPARLPDLEVGTPTVDDASLDAGETFTLSATVSNAGVGNTVATTLRYYRSTNETISRTDRQVGEDAVGALSASEKSAETISLTAPSTSGTYYYGACVDAVTGESDTTNNCSSSVQVDVTGSAVGDPGFDIDIVFVDPKPSAAVRGAITGAAAVWEGVITDDFTDMDFSGDPEDNACTDQEFAGFVDDLRVYVYVVDIDGPGGTTASAGFCLGRSGSNTPVIGRIRFDSSDLNRLSTTNVRLVAVHELAHVLGFGVRWNVQNPSLQRGEPVTPPPDTYLPGAKAVAAFDAAGGSSYQGGKVPVENERGGSGSQDRHWRLSVMPGELMTYNLDGAALSAITIQSMADLGYTVNANAADSYTISSTGSLPPGVATAREVPFRCEIDLLPVEYVPEVLPASP